MQLEPGSAGLATGAVSPFLEMGGVRGAVAAAGRDVPVAGGALSP